jgi:hypothetical protein
MSSGLVCKKYGRRSMAEAQPHVQGPTDDPLEHDVDRAIDRAGRCRH